MPNILVVDDTPENLRVLGDILEEQYEVRVATSGPEALAAVRASPPDLILLDIIMPGMGGYEICRELKANAETKAIPIIFISALGMSEHKIQAFREGAVDYITKPFQTEEVAARVRTHLDLSKVADLKREVAERKRAEDELRAVEAKQSAMIANIGDVIVIIDAGNTTKYVSPNIEMWFGWRPEEILGQSPWDRVHPEDLDIARAQHAAIAGKAGAGSKVEYRYRCKDGSHKWIEFLARNLLHDPTIAGFLGNFHDVTARKEAEAEKAALERRLHQAEKMEALGSLAGGIAHDFNNILTAILGNAELLLAEENHTADHAKKQDAVEDILKASGRARDLVRQILTFSRRREQQRTPQQLAPIIDEVAKLLHASLPANVEIVQSVATDVPIVLSDTTQIHQVLMNLATNAVHAMGERGGMLRLELSQKTVATEAATAHGMMRPGRYARLRVSDTGCGMPTDVRERIFEPFFTTKPLGEGTGLGLSVVHGVVMNHEGTIQVESEPGHGTTFEIMLPAFIGDTAAMVAENSSTPKGRGQRIVFVDDEELLVRIGSRLLERLGYEVAPFAAAEAALAEMKKAPKPFDLVISDWSMPKMSGLEFALAVLRLAPKTPIILATGNPLTLEASRGLPPNSYSLLHKPYDVATLAKTVARALAEASP